jgi:hypothetical protein
MSSSLYIDQLLNDIDILCIQEHHLSPMSINFLKTLNREFDATVLLSSVLTQGNEYMYHNQQA